jgi:hypothetical protein
VCEEGKRLRLAFDESADAFSRAVPELRQRPNLQTAEMEGVINAVAQRVDEALDAFERHMKEHRC